jgi:hypothetical protein
MIASKQATSNSYSIVSLSKGFFYTIIAEANSDEPKKSRKTTWLEKPIDPYNDTPKRKKHPFK